MKAKDETGSEAWVLKNKMRKVKAVKWWEVENGDIIEVGMR